ncbi:MAG: nucleoside phosphorylase [Bacteroidales bacterium]|nr:nucleoside phosphorylase [Bacteroidales bacterium]
MEPIIEASEMPLNPDGSIYHLHLQPEQLAENIILVGDPGRVPTVSKFFDSIEHKVQNRELVTHTGKKNGKSVTALSTGMGTDNIDIVINELDALVNVNLKDRTRKTKHKSLNLIRLGTSGSFQPEYGVNSFCASEYGLGLDGLLNYYKVPDSIFEKEMMQAFEAHMQMPASFARPYIVKCAQELLDKVAFDMQKGITATAPGFFAPQGRVVRVPLTFPNQNDLLTSFRFQNHKISNMEMETSALYGLGRSLGHRCLTVCVLIANRCDKSFSKDYKPYVENLIETVLKRLTA